MTKPQPPPRALLVTVLTAGLSAISASALLIRATDASGLATATARVLISTLLMGLIARITLGDTWHKLTRREAGLCTLAGLFLGLHFWSWMTSLDHTSVASSVLFVTLNPIFVGLAAPLVTKDKLTRTLWIGIALAMLGSIIVGVDDLLSQEGQDTLLGNGLALLGSICASGYLLAGRIARQTVPLATYATATNGAAALLLLPIATLSQETLWSAPLPTWGMFALIALVPQLIGHNSLVWSLRHLSAPMVSLIILAEPIGAGLLAWWWLDETPTGFKLLGAVLLLAGIFIATTKRD